MTAFQLDGLSVFITGASSGVGRAAAYAVSAAGGRVVAVGRRSDALETTLDSLLGHGHVAIRADVTDHNLIPDLMDKAVSAVGPLHGLVHCAGEHLLSPPP